MQRNPHIDVVDDTAQALQMLIKTGEGEYTCLFRKFRKLRAIDWYHVIQKARVNLSV